MSWYLYHRKKDDKYRIYSTVVNDYLTEWEEREVIEDFWIGNRIKNDIEVVRHYMDKPDKEI